ncbi:MAG: ethanolamine utilization protein EutM [Clostridium sp.]|jgi:ethanolamine utilization protein EutM
MKQYEAIGIIEAKYFTTALQLVDTMCKASEVEFLGSENSLGGRLVTTIVGGSVSNVCVAVEAARRVCAGQEEILKNAVVITKPHAEIMKFIALRSWKLLNRKIEKKIEKNNEELIIENQEK